MINKIIILLFFTTSILSKPVSAKTTPLNSLFSMNLQCTKNQWKMRVDQILNQVITISPDIISFQEACVGEEQDMLTYIKLGLEKRGYPIASFEFQKTHLSWNIFQEYLLIISKHKHSMVKKGFLPKSPLLRAYLSIKHNGIWYINTHLEHRADYHEYRRKQIKFLINKYKDRSHIMMGDFNSSPKHPEQSAFLVNDYLNFFPYASRPSHKPTSAIDGFWISREISWYYLKSNIKTLFTKPYNGTYLSDHLAVWLKVSGKDLSQ